MDETTRDDHDDANAPSPLIPPRLGDAAADAPPPLEPNPVAHPPAWGAPPAPPVLGAGAPSYPGELHLAGAPASAAPTYTTLPPLDADPRARRGLTIWLLVILVLGVGGVFAGWQELSVLLAAAGIFAVAQAADLDRDVEWLYYMVSWLVPVGGALTFFAIAGMIAQGDSSRAMQVIGVGTSAGIGVIALLTMARPISNRLVSVFFGEVAPNHTLRMSARLVLLFLLFVIPGVLFFRGYLWDMMNSGVEFFDRKSLGSSLIGYVALALAGVGWLVRRDWKATAARLGLRPVSAKDLAVMALGVVGIFALNSGADWIQHQVFPDLWDADRQVNQRLASGLGPAQIILLGLSAGIGEEITMRGALQPKLGVVLTALLFASLHVQYTWFGIVVIFLLGTILGLIRRHTSTTVAIGVHVLYDVLAVITT